MVPWRRACDGTFSFNGVQFKPISACGISPSPSWRAFRSPGGNAVESVRPEPLAPGGVLVRLPVASEEEPAGQSGPSRAREIAWPILSAAATISRSQTWTYLNVIRAGGFLIDPLRISRIVSSGFGWFFPRSSDMVGHSDTVSAAHFPSRQLDGRCGDDPGAPRPSVMAEMGTAVEGLRLLCGIAVPHGFGLRMPHPVRHMVDFWNAVARLPMWQGRRAFRRF